MNGTNRVVPMNGNGGRYYMVSPVSLVEYDQVPMDWIPADLPEESKMYLRTAYMMGDKRALNGKLGAKLKAAVQKVADKVGDINILGTNVGQTYDEKVLPKAKEIGTVAMKVAQVAVPLALTATGFGGPAAAGAAAAIGAVNKKIAADQAKKQAEAAGLSQSQQNEAAKIAADSSQALTDVGIEADPQVVADRAVMAADMGVKSKSTGFFGFLDNLTPTQKVVGGLAISGLGYGAYRFFKKKKGKGGRKK